MNSCNKRAEPIVITVGYQAHRTFYVHLAAYLEGLASAQTGEHSRQVVLFVLHTSVSLVGQVHSHKKQEFGMERHPTGWGLFSRVHV
jgi:hypothetical protein